MDNSYTDKHISLTIGGKSYPIIVTEEEATYIRELERKINEELLSFQKTYAGISNNDSVAMLLIHKMVELYQLQNEMTALRNQVDHISQMINHQL